MLSEGENNEDNTFPNKNSEVLEYALEDYGSARQRDGETRIEFSSFPLASRNRGTLAFWNRTHDAMSSFEPP